MHVTQRHGPSERQNPLIFRCVCWEGMMIGLTALAGLSYHADKLHLCVEMCREVAHQTDLFELSLGGHSPRNELFN